jgi:hypothetical protein
VSAAAPDATGEFRVENRSDRVWVYGYLRVAPPILWFGGLLGFVFAVDFVRVHPAAGLTILAAILIGPLILDRSTLLDPVDFVRFGNPILIKRLAGKRELPSDRLLQVRIGLPTGEDFDEKQRARRYAELTLRFRGARSAWLLVSHSDAVRVAAWAAARQIPVTESRG